MKRKNLKVISSVLAAFLFAGMLSSTPVRAEGFTGWKTDDNGNKFWYENDVKQGTEGRGKEIFDPGSNAWYWLDSVDGGKMAVSKDVYQESLAGDWGDIAGEDGLRYGKWVRYDENGHMIKGWSTDTNGTYYFDYTYGTMAKGTVEIDGTQYYFNEGTGILESGNRPDDNMDGNTNGWVTIDGTEYWYENGIRQGTEGRGKEIFDPNSNAWYWLDAVDNGKKTVSKDVYQESLAGDWGDIAGEDGLRYGKWVRYDENGHMIKGWSTTENGTYYFDPTYGTMAKGEAVIDGKTYQFDANTGILVEDKTTEDSDGADTDTDDTNKDDTNTGNDTTEEGEFEWLVTGYRNYNASGDLTASTTYEYNAQGICTKRSTTGTSYSSTSTFNDNGDLLCEVNFSNGSETTRIECTYDEQGNLLVWNNYSAGEPTSKTTYTYENGNVIRKITTNLTKGTETRIDYYYATDINTKIVTEYKWYPDALSPYTTVEKFDMEGNILLHEYSNQNGVITDKVVYSYNDDGLLEKKETYQYSSSKKKLTLYSTETYEYDSYGNMTKRTSDSSYTEIVYERYNDTSRIVSMETATAGIKSGYTYEYDGALIKKYTSYTRFMELSYWEEYTYKNYSENCEAYTEIIQAYNADGSKSYAMEYDYQKFYIK